MKETGETGVWTDVQRMKVDWCPEETAADKSPAEEHAMDRSLAKV
jgi:hypothetical protein